LKKTWKSVSVWSCSAENAGGNILYLASKLTNKKNWIELKEKYYLIQQSFHGF